MKKRFKAYISYSHRDEKWAIWLHRALESYRIPRKLLGKVTSIGKVPPRIKPVFRDRDDLSSSSDLADTVKQALTDSENLILVCSPDSARSPWVNEEVRYFASLGRSERIFCIIVDGDPAAKDAGSNCFPQALTEIGLQEPLAADVRKWADGKRLSKLKLIAGMLGLPLDQLRRRDMQKRQRAWAFATVAAIAITAVLISAITSRIAAEQRRISGESLVEYKLAELRTMLNVETDPEELTRLDDWDQQSLAELVDSAGNEENALENAAMRLRDQGSDAYQGGDLGQALENYQASWALLAESYRQDRNNKSILFELGQAEFYIGQALLDLGRLDEAESAFFNYAEITRRLIVAEPENAAWVLEMAYALTNLGYLESEKPESNPERTLQLIHSALEYNQIALVLDPQNADYKFELGQSHAFLADAQRGVCDLEGALLSRQKNIALEREMLEMDSDNPRIVRRLAYALSGYSGVQRMMGDTTEAIQSLEETIQLIQSLLAANPEDQALKQYLLHRKHRLAIQKAVDGNMESASQIMQTLEAEWTPFLESMLSADLKTIYVYTTHLVDRAWLENQGGHSDLALEMLEQAMTISTETLRKFPGNRTVGNQLMLASYRYWEIKQELPPDSILTILPYYYNNSGSIRACHDASLAARKAIMLGATTRARELTEYLLGNGYREALFMRTCKAHSYCKGFD